MLPARAAWAVTVVTVVSRSALATVVALLLWGVLPNAVGLPTTTVLSGSMSPRLQVGDVVVVRPVDAAGMAGGQVLLFTDPDHADRLRLHRLVAVGADGRLVTKGDANAARDSSTVALDAVRGAGFLRIPYAGLPNLWLRTGQWGKLAVGAGALLVLLVGVRLGRLLEDPEDRVRRRHRGVRLPALHRAAAGGAVLLALGGALPGPVEGADAAWSGRTATTASTWGTTCGDAVRTGLTGSPRLYWGFGSGTGSTVPDLSGQSATGVLAGDATRSGCVAGASPSLAVGGSTGGGVADQAVRSYPGDTTVATWFRTSSAGGVLADFGSSNTAPASALVDRAMYLRADGALVFGGATVQVAGLMGAPLLCASPPGLADGRWHLAVATWSASWGCTLRIDDVLVATNRPAIALSVLGGYPGYWRFGYETLSTTAWTGATSRGWFSGSLDETQVYGSVLSTAAQSAILARGH